MVLTEERDRRVQATDKAIGEAVEEFLPMTDDRYAELSGITRWWWERVREIEKLLKPEGRAAGYDEDDITRMNAARVALRLWRDEKEAALNITQAEWDEYEVRSEGEIEAIESRREEAMR